MIALGFIIGFVILISLLYVPLLAWLAFVFKERKNRGFLFWLGILFLILFAFELYFAPTRSLLLLDIYAV